MVWEGYELETGVYQGYEYGIVFPKEMAPGRPYVWRAEFFGAFPSVDLAMLEKGYAVVYFRICDLYGSPKAVGLMEMFQPFIQEKYRLSFQTILFGFSRGGLYALHYAAKHPERIAALYLDAPVVDIYSWPGGFFSGEGALEEWEDCRKLWGLSHDDFMDRVKLAVQTLLAWEIPLILVVGGKDGIVPYYENGVILQEAYEKSRAAFQLIMKPDCGHHPHSLEDPSPVVSFLLKNKSYPTWGNAFRINDQSKTRYPLTLIIHDTGHLDLVMQAEGIFWGRYPLGYVGTSPWPGTVTNQKIMDYADSQNIGLYDLLREQMEIGWVVYGLGIGQGKEKDIQELIKDMEDKCPQARQFWLLRKEEKVSSALNSILQEYGIRTVEITGQQEFGVWLENLTGEIEKAQPPEHFDFLEREDAEWTNLSVALPVGEGENRILLVGDSISAGYGDMVQKLMPGWHVDRLNTSEGLHHPNFGRMLKIALGRYSYRIIHINNGIHLHGQSVEQYGRNLLKIFNQIHKLASGARIVFATTTPISRSLSGDELDGFDARHFSMGDKAPVDQGGTDQEEFWVVDGQASEIYRKLNETAKKICAEFGIRVNDLYQLSVDENLQKSDGVHFKEEAYWRLAARIAEVLQEELS